MRLIIKDQPHEVASWVASYVVRRIRVFAPTPARPFVLGLPTGSSPLAMYKELIKAHQAGEVSFANVITFKCVGKWWWWRVK
jgi:glucosamine-6-phosphate deaminase